MICRHRFIGHLLDCTPNIISWYHIIVCTWLLRDTVAFSRPVIPNFLRFRHPLNLLTCAGCVIWCRYAKLVVRPDFLSSAYNAR